MNSSPQEPISKATFRGLIGLGFVLVLIFVLPDLIHFFTPSKAISISFYDDQTQEKIKQLQNQGPNYQSKYKKESRYIVPQSKFNPNDYTLLDWQALGLSKKQAAVVLKFTKRKLRSNDDLKRIFVISDELFQLIKDSTIYPNEMPMITDNSNELNSSKLISVNLNSASPEELMEIKGIGPTYAKLILKKRDELGGFYSSDQLLEVWKMDQERLNTWLPYLKINPNDLKKINLNTVSAEELKTHPYVSWNLANSIVKLRTQIGVYKKIDEVKRSVLMTDDIYNKLKFYLKVEE